MPEPLPDDGPRREHGFVSARQALRGIHRPDSWAEKGAAEKRLRFDEAFVTQTVLAQRRAALLGPRRAARAPAATAGCSTGSTSGCRSS